MKPTGNEDDMRMPAADFDRIMGKVMGPKGQEQKESGFYDDLLFGFGRGQVKP